MQMRVSLLVLALAVCLVRGQDAEEEEAAAMCTGSAMYRVTNNCEWTRMRHPVDYPSGASFSPLCGTSHNSDYDMFSEGGTSTEGVKDVAEEGDCAALESEVNECVDGGYCLEGSYFSWNCMRESGAGTGVCTHNGTIEVTPEYPYVSMISMAVPSPDWFVGVSSLGLCVEGEDGEYEWIETYPMGEARPLNAYDAGTDAGESFQSENMPVGDPYDPISVLEATDDSNIFYNNEAEMLYPLCQLMLERM